MRAIGLPFVKCQLEERSIDRLGYFPKAPFGMAPVRETVVKLLARNKRASIREVSLPSETSRIEA